MTGFWPGIVVGAVYSPVELIVPATELPPLTPPADQLTAVLVRPVTVAVYWVVLPRPAVTQPLGATEID